MKSVIDKIERMLREGSEEGYGHCYVAGAHWQKRALSLETFKRQVGRKLPGSFYDFYAWMLAVDFPTADLQGKTSFDDDTYGWKPSLDRIIDETAHWNEIKQEQPDRLWEEGFIAFYAWDGYRQLAIDTLGKVCGKPGMLLAWDYKGGSGYEIIAANFDRLLCLEYEYLKERLYFPPPVDSPDYEAFWYGPGQDRRLEIIKILNPEIRNFFIDRGM